MSCYHLIPMYMETKCKKCEHWVGVTCFRCGRCNFCHKGSDLLPNIVGLVVIAAVIAIFYFGIGYL